jgi:hypothetical protein
MISRIAASTTTAAVTPGRGGSRTPFAVAGRARAVARRAAS